MGRRRGRRLIGVLAVGVALSGLAAGGVAARTVDAYRLFVVHTGSMEPAITPGDIVVDRRDITALKPGDVITFRYSDSSTEVVTHRVAAIDDDGTITTKGDANDTDDLWAVRPDQVIGRVTALVPGLGYAVVYLQHPTGLVSLATTVLCIALLWQLFFPSPPPVRSGAPGYVT